MNTLKQPGARVGAVLEVVHRAPRDEEEGAAFRIDPAVADKQRRPTLEDVEDLVVLLVEMRAGTFRVGLQPPFGDAVAIRGLLPVAL